MQQCTYVCVRMPKEVYEKERCACMLQKMLAAQQRKNIAHSFLGMVEKAKGFG